jgi:hypothetical protein
MNKRMPWFAIGALLLPILLRVLWFYPGIPSRPEIPTPGYAELTVPTPPAAPPDGEDETIDQPGGIVVVDNSHVNQFRPAEIQSLQEAVELRGGRLEFLSDSSLLEETLKYADAFLVISPSMNFLPQEIKLISTFTDRGGRLAVLTDATRGLVFSDYYSGALGTTPDTDVVNPLLAAYGITVNNDYLYNLSENEGNFRNVFFDEFGKSELTFGLKQVALYGAHSVESDSGSILLKASEKTYSSITDAHDPGQGGAALAANLNVIVFGDFTFLTHPYRHVGDNRILIANLSDFLLGGEHAASLETFPYLFGRPQAQAFVTSEVQLTAEMIGALGGLQASLRAVGVSMEITNEKPSEGDVLVLGRYAENEDLDPYLKKFDITIGEKLITLPGYGEIGRAGNGLMMFDTAIKGNSLILLADTQEDLIALIDVINSGSLSSCVLQPQVGLCSVGSGEGFPDEEGSAGDLFDGLSLEDLLRPSEEPPGEEPVTPEPEPTPSG